MTKRGMGRGLAAILPESGIGEPQFRHVPIDLIRPNPGQPRTEFDAGTIDGLAASIADAGVVQPLIIRPLSDGRYELIAGERRWRAARQAKLDTVPALIRNQDEGERLQTALIENMAREDLNPGGRGARLRRSGRRPRAFQGGARPQARPKSRRRSPTSFASSTCPTPCSS